MTKKDYELIAQELMLSKPSRKVLPYDIETQGQSVINTYCYGRDNAWYNTCMTLSDGLTIDNPRFDKEKFLKACGIKD